MLLRKQEPRAHGQSATALGSCFRGSTWIGSIKAGKPLARRHGGPGLGPARAYAHHHAAGRLIPQ